MHVGGRPLPNDYCTNDSVTARSNHIGLNTRIDRDANIHASLSFFKKPVKSTLRMPLVSDVALHDLAIFHQLPGFQSRRRFSSSTSSQYRDSIARREAARAVYSCPAQPHQMPGNYSTDWFARRHIWRACSICSCLSRSRVELSTEVLHRCSSCRLSANCCSPRTRRSLR